MKTEASVGEGLANPQETEGQQASGLGLQHLGPLRPGAEARGHAAPRQARRRPIHSTTGEIKAKAEVTPSPSTPNKSSGFYPFF